MSRSQKIIFSLLGVAAVVLFAIGAGFDLAIDQSLYAPQNPFGIFMEGVCWWPLYLPFALAGALLAKERGAKRPLGWLLFALTLALLCKMALDSFMKRGWSAPVSVAAFLVPAAAIAAALWACVQTSAQTRKRLQLMAGFGIFFCVTNNIIINLLKLIWRRPRFDDLLAAGNLTAFSPWYAPGGAGGSSFPSGHTAAACGILVLLLVPVLFSRFRGHAGVITLCCYGYIALAGFARMVIGRHYLSDTVAAAVVATLLYFALLALPAVRRRIAWAAQ